MPGGQAQTGQAGLLRQSRSAPGWPVAPAGCSTGVKRPLTQVCAGAAAAIEMWISADRVGERFTSRRGNCRNCHRIKMPQTIPAILDVDRDLTVEQDGTP